MQDSVGYLWFATYSGLDRYDGNTFVSYRHDPADRNSIINARGLSLCEDRKGYIWVGTWQGLEKFDRATGEFRHYLPHPGADSTGWENVVFAVHEDREGILWIGTGGGLYVCDRHGDSTVTLRRFQGDSETPIHKAVRSIVEDRSGRLWVATGCDVLQFDRGIRRFVLRWRVPDKPNGEIEPRKISEHWIFVIREDHDGVLWLATNGGLVKFNPDSQTSFIYRHDPNRRGSLNDNVVLTVGEDASRTIWVGTDYGLDRFDRASGLFTNFLHDDRDPRSLKSNRIYSIFSERSGTLWISTGGGGVHKLNRSTPLFTSHRPKAQGSAPVATNFTGGLAEIDSGRIWANTYFNGIEEFSPRTDTFGHLGPRVPFRILMKGPGRSVWIAPVNGELGMALLDQHGRLIPFRDAQGHTIGHAVVGMCPSREGFIWVATDFDLWMMEAATHSFTHVRNVKASGLSYVHEDSSGMVWIGTVESGLFCYDRTHDSLTLFTHDPENPHSISGNAINAIMEDTAEGPWFGTDTGLNRFDRQTRTFTRFSAKDGLPNSGVFAILRDAHEILWLGTFAGLVRFDPTTKMAKTFYWSYVLPSVKVNFWNAFKASNGEMYFGSEDGLIRFHPDSIKDNPYVPPIVITMFKKFDKPAHFESVTSEKKPLEVSYKDNVVSFEFAALNYTSPERNHYAYQMAGFDTGWVYCGTRHTATYTNLDPGEYTFRVKGSNNDGVWNEVGTSIAVIITPPLWKRWWFTTLSWLAVAVAGAGTVRYIEISKIRRQMRVLEQQRALEHERLRISQDMHDEVGATLTQISILSELAKKQAQQFGEPGGPVDRISEKSREVIENIGEIIWAINPNNDQLENLVAYLRRYALQYFRSSSILCRFHAPGVLSAISLSAETRRNIFLVCKEAMHNVIKHSQATEVDLTLQQLPGLLEMVVQDNGRGFSPADLSHHGNGLKNMRRRMEEIGGSFTISSRPDHGTCVTLRTPLRNEPSTEKET